jgi:hypothetical protein
MTQICAVSEVAAQMLPGVHSGGSARGYLELFAVGNPDHGGADSSEVVFLYIASARRELPLLPVD